MAYKYVARPQNLEYAKPDKIDNLLYRLLSMCTPGGLEDKIIAIIDNLPYVQKYKRETISGNLVIHVGDNPETLFSAHMDIVGETTPMNKQKGYADLIHLMEDPKDLEIYYGAKSFETKLGKFWFSPSTLGADDKVGCWILCKLIEKGVKGLYIFHHGEERGGIGSIFLANNRKELFTGIKRAIAYDRAGYTDVIGSQRGRKCCSPEFGEALAKALNEYMPPQSKFKEGAVGSFTDTASYMDIIPECTNISCGYFNQHGVNEHFDYLWLNTFLLPAALNINYDSLPTVRDHTKKDTPAWSSYGWGWRDDNEWYGGGYTPGKPININDKYKKTWLTATKNTPPMDLPEWTPKVGYVEEADREVLIRAVKHHIVIGVIKDKENLAEYIVELMETNALLLEEVEGLQVQVDMMSGEVIGPPIKLGELVDITIGQKKELLIRMAEKILSVQFKDKCPHGYAREAINFLKIISKYNTKSSISKNKMKKFDKLFFYLMYILSVSNINTNNEVRILLNDASDFMEKHFEKDLTFALPDNLKAVKNTLPAIYHPDLYDDNIV